MKCKCGGDLRITRTVSAGESAKAHETTCPACHRTYVAVTTILHEQGAYGSGPHAVARRIRSGELKVKVEHGHAERRTA